MNLSTGGFRLWPFGRKAEPNKRQLNSLPSGQQTLTAMPPVKQQALLYLDATLAVLQREGIPLARPVHGKPARGARFIEIPINLDRQRVGPAAMRKIFNSGTISAIEAAARVDSVNVWQVRDAIIYQYQLDQALWKYYRRADLPSPEGIGLGVGRSLVPLGGSDPMEVAALGKPVVIGNCQAGWALMMLAAKYPDLCGPLIVAGAPLSYWAGVRGVNSMRYTGGLLEHTVAVAELNLMLTPLTKAELEQEAIAWRDILKNKVKEFGETELKALAEIALGAGITVITDEAGGNTFLYWTEDGVTVTVAGHITFDEALQVAESLR